MVLSRKKLFEEFTFPNGNKLKNRAVMAPMTTCAGFYDGTVTDDLIKYYKERAGSIGAIIVECGFVDHKGIAFPGAIGLDHDDRIDGLSKISKSIKEKCSKAIIQIYHGGRMVDPKLIGGQTPVGPSAIAAPRPNSPIPTALTEEEVEQMIDKFAQAVRRAIQAGFDGVELHGANTYLLQQFFSPNSNQRNDKWGGNRENRARFPLEVLEITHRMAKKYASDEFIIGYRFSPEEIEVPGIRFDDSLYLLDKLAKKGLDYIHFSMGQTLRPSIIDTEDPTPLIQKYRNQRSKALANIPVIGVGNVINIEDADHAFDNGYDLVAIGRPCIAYPDWIDRIANNEHLKLFIDSDKRESLNIPEPLWRFPLVESIIRDVNLANKKFKTGIYQEEVNDEKLSYQIGVNLGEDYIKDLELINISEIPEESIRNFNEIKNRIIEANSPLVDAITGATSQSEAFKKAVSRAMEKSNKEAIIAKGGNPDEVNVDVVVIGSGGAGLSAAIEAHDNGAKVMIVEKMPIIGGNTNKASAGMNAAETKFQKQKNIEDHKSLFYQETFIAGKEKNNPELLQYFVENSSNAINWLDEKGIELSNLTTTGGMSIDRTHRPVSGASVGRFLISGLMKNINKRNIKVLFDTSATKIIFENNQVKGIEIITEDNEIKVINSKAVIVATGGFSANSKMVEYYRPDLKGFITTNHKGAIGSGIELLKDVGSDTVDMQEIQIHPTVEQKTSYLISESIRGEGAILVNQQGNRFINELTTRDKVSSAILHLPEHYSYILFDQQIRNNNKTVEEYFSQGFILEASSIENLAEKLSIDAINLNKTIKRYNSFVESKNDLDFNRTTGLRSSISRAPFYAIKVAPGVHHTMGGVTINSMTEVINKDKLIIQGIYAAGEVTGGIHGANRVGGNAVSDIIIFGIQAGRNAAKYIKETH